MTKNLKKIETMRAADASVMALVLNQAVVASKEGIAELETVLTKKS